MPLYSPPATANIITARLASDHVNSTTTGTEVSLGAAGLVAGTYIFQYYLLIQSSLATTSPNYAINFTGTATTSHRLIFNDGGPLTAGTATALDTGGLGAATPMSGNPRSIFGTTVGLMNHQGGVSGINTNTIVTIDGLLVVTATGDLELWHASETAVSTTIKADSSLIVTRTA